MGFTRAPFATNAHDLRCWIGKETYDGIADVLNGHFGAL
jgi:hypothetical protein